MEPRKGRATRHEKKKMLGKDCPQTVTLKGRKKREFNKQAEIGDLIAQLLLNH